MNVARAKELIVEHASLRKSAFAAAAKAGAEYFDGARNHLGGMKTAAEASQMNPALLRHLTNP